MRAQSSFSPPVEELYVECLEFNAFEKNTLRGFATIGVPSWGIKISGITLHTRNASTWIGLPSKKFTAKDGAEGWQPTVDYLDDDAKQKFQRAAVHAIEEFIRTSKS